MSDYQPIACVEHERLEFAVLRRMPLRLGLHNGVVLQGLPEDVYTQAGAEWLKLREISGTQQVIRLDLIKHFSEV